MIKTAFYLLTILILTSSCDSSLRNKGGVYEFEINPKEPNLSKYFKEIEQIRSNSGRDYFGISSLSITEVSDLYEDKSYPYPYCSTFLSYKGVLEIGLHQNIDNKIGMSLYLFRPKDSTNFEISFINANSCVNPYKRYSAGKIIKQKIILNKSGYIPGDTIFGSIDITTKNTQRIMEQTGMDVHFKDGKTTTRHIRGDFVTTVK